MAQKINQSQSVQTMELIGEYNGTIGLLTSPVSIPFDTSGYKFIKFIGRAEQAANTASISSLRFRVNGQTGNVYDRRLIYFEGNTSPVALTDTVSHLYLGASNWQASGIQWELTAALSRGWLAFNGNMYNDYANRSYFGWQRWQGQGPTSIQIGSDGAGSAYSAVVGIYGIR